MKRFGIFFLFLAFTSCLNEANCLITSTNLVKISLLKSSDKTPNPITFSSIKVSGTSLIFYENIANVTTLVLPVDPTANETTFTLNFNNQTEVITLDYSKEIRLISESCGAYQYMKSLNVKSTTLTNVKVVNDLLLTQVTSNVEIFF